MGGVEWVVLSRYNVNMKSSELSKTSETSISSVVCMAADGGGAGGSGTVAAMPTVRTHGMPAESNPEGLAVRERLFVAQYLKCLDPGEAAEGAGYSDAAIGFSLIRIPRVRAAIDKELDVRAMRPRDVVAQIEKLAGGIGNAVVVDASGALSVDFKKLKALGLVGNVRKVIRTSEGFTNVEFYDRQNALITLAKIHGLLQEKLQITGENDGPIQVQNVRNSMQELMQNPEALQAMLQLSAQLAMQPQIKGAMPDIVVENVKVIDKVGDSVSD